MRGMGQDVMGSGLFEGLLTDPAPGPFETGGESIAEPAAIGIAVDRHASGRGRQRVIGGNFGQEGVLQDCQGHAGTRSDRPRASASSANRSASGGIWSSRSIMVATGPRRSTAEA